MKRSRKLFALAGTVLALGAALPAATAFAKNGADDPAGHVGHGGHGGHGGDDGPRHQ